MYRYDITTTIIVPVADLYNILHLFRLAHVHLWEPTGVFGRACMYWSQLLKELYCTSCMPCSMLHVKPITLRNGRVPSVSICMVKLMAGCTPVLFLYTLLWWNDTDSLHAHHCLRKPMQSHWLVSRLFPVPLSTSCQERSGQASVRTVHAMSITSA